MRYGGAQWRPTAYPDELFVRSLMDESAEIIYFKDLHSRFVRVSKAFAERHGRDPAEMLGLSDHDLFLREHANKALRDERLIIGTGEAMVDMRERERWPDRADTWVHTSKFCWRTPDGGVIGTFGVSRDVTEQVRVEREQERSAAMLQMAHVHTSLVETQLRSVLDGSRDPILVYDLGLRCRYLNPAAAAFHRRPADEVLGSSDREMGASEAWVAAWESALRSALDSGHSQLVEVAREEDGDLRWYQASLTPEVDKRGRAMGVLATIRDITEMKREGLALAHQATHCSLTGLANRYLLLDRAEHALARLERRSTSVALVFVDLDGFKPVNDTHGHQTGDMLLMEVARRLEGVARKADTVARLGGDEFVLLCEGAAGRRDAERLAARVVSSVSEPVELSRPGTQEGLEVSVTVSAGVAVTAEPTVTSDELLAAADAAMYAAKEAGGNAYRVAEPLG